MDIDINVLPQVIIACFVFHYYCEMEKEKAPEQNILSFSFLIGIHSMQGRTATRKHGVTRKKCTRRLKHTGNLFRKDLQLIGVC